MFPDGDIAGPNSNTSFDPVVEYSTDKVVLFWQPPSYFPPWSPSSFAVDDVPYSCEEQYMMAEKTRLFQDHRAVELIMSSPSQAHANTSVEACAALTPVLGTGRSKTPCYLAPTPNSRNIPP